MTAIRALLVPILVIVALAACESSDETWTPPGPAIGDPFPSTLALPDQTGRTRNISELQGKRGAVVVFVRSADWCSFCMRQLADVNAQLPRFEALGLSVVSVSVDSVEHAAKFHREQRIGYTMLADEAGMSARALAIVDPQYRAGSKEYGVPEPIIFVLDHNGIVRAKFAEHGYRNQPDLERVLAELAKLDFG